MPPHTLLSGQSACPLGFEEHASTRMSGAKDHTWKRLPGAIQKKPSMLLLGTGCRPVSARHL
jgi:hypothetical protein